MSIERTRPIRILVVDDDAEYLRLMNLFLHRNGHTVLLANSGQEAEEHAEGVDLALIDMIMPELSGLETIALLQGRNPKLKIIASSGCFESDFRAELDRLGVETFLQKPFAPERLLEQINLLISGASV